MLIVRIVHRDIYVGQKTRGMNWFLNKNYAFKFFPTKINFFMITLDK